MVICNIAQLEITHSFLSIDLPSVCDVHRYLNFLRAKASREGATLQDFKVQYVHMYVAIPTNSVWLTGVLLFS